MGMKLYFKLWNSLQGISIYNDSKSSENYEDKTQLTFKELSLQSPLFYPENKRDSYIHIKRRMKLK
jgi:hypothetical protein